ncbi:monooxygenase, partial [Micromonospora sp. NPDC049799]
ENPTPSLYARPFGVGEAPLGWQGTVSVWRDQTDLVAFAYRHPEHRAAITRTPTEGWYAEELFARFEVRDVVGDRAVLGWVTDERGRA